jgi:hypothetical protein
MTKNKILSAVFGVGCVPLFIGLIGILATEPNAEWALEAATLV